MNYACPLCHQSVSQSLYNEITGIWRERDKLLTKIREQRRGLAKKAAEFEKRKRFLVQRAVEKQTKPLELKVRMLKLREKEIEKGTRARLRKLATNAQKADLVRRRKLNKRIREQNTDFRRKMNLEREKIRRESVTLKRENVRSVQLAVRKQAKRFETQSKALKLKETQIEKKAHEKIRRATELAHARAETAAAKRLGFLKEQLDASVRKRLGLERERLRRDTNRFRNRYVKASQSYKNTLAEVKAKDRKLREQAQHFNSIKKQLRRSMKTRLIQEKEHGAHRLQKKYERLGRTFKHTLTQMTIKDRELQERARQIVELRKQLERQTTPQLEGLLYEKTLMRELKKRYPSDKFDHPGKGGDVVQRIMQNDIQAGIIVYECKRVKRYSTDHVKQAAEAKKQRDADFAILVTNAMKKGTHGFFTEKGVILVHATGVLPLASVLREQVIRIGHLKLGQLERRKAVKLTLEYLEGPEFSNSIEVIIEESIGLVTDMKDEVKKHVATWKKRYNSYQKICTEAFTIKDTTATLLTGESVQKLVPKGTLPELPPLPELHEAEKEDAEEVQKPSRNSVPT